MDKSKINAKEYLSQIHSINTKLKSLAFQRQSIEDALHNVSPKLSHTPKNATRDVHQMEGLIAAKLDIEADIERFSERLAEVHKTIAAFPAAELGAVITYRYISRLPWEDIAIKLHISESRVYQLHREALRMVENIITEREVKSA